MASVVVSKHIDSGERYIESVEQGLYYWKYDWKALLRVISYSSFSFWCSSTDQILVERRWVKGYAILKALHRALLKALPEVLLEAL